MTGVLTGVMTMVLTELIIGVGAELVTGVGVKTPCIVFSLILEGYPHCLSSFLNWLRSPSPPAVLPANDVFFFFFFSFFMMVLLLLVVSMLLLLSSCAVPVTNLSGKTSSTSP